jgi:hypothetical protein
MELLLGAPKDSEAITVPSYITSLRAEAKPERGIHLFTRWIATRFALAMTVERVGPYCPKERKSFTSCDAKR